MKKIQVELSTPIPYAMGSGNEVEGGFLEITEPTGKIAHLVGTLKTELGAATKKSIEGLDLSDAEAEDGPTLEPDQLGEASLAVLTMGSADMGKVFLTLKEILRETAQVGGEKLMTAPMFDRMMYTDIEKVLRAYLGNFLAASDS